MTVDDDWAPLPPESVPLAGETQRERPARPPLPEPPLRPRSRTAPLPPPPTAAERAAADAALVAMHQRLKANKPAARDPVQRVVARRSRQNVTAHVLSEETPPPPVVPDEDRVPGVGAIDYGIDRDPREDEPWFRQLPPREQLRLQKQWHDQRHRHDLEHRIPWRDVRRAAIQGGVLFFVFGVLQAPMLQAPDIGGCSPILLLTIAGAIAAALARLCRGGRVAFAFAGLVAYMLVMLPALQDTVLSPIGLSSILIATFGMGLLGLDREMRRSGGFRDDDEVAARADSPTQSPSANTSGRAE